MTLEMITDLRAGTPCIILYRFTLHWRVLLDIANM